MDYNADLRRDYESRPLRRTDLLSDPVEQFRVWFQTALELAPTEANVTVLATTSGEGRPSARVVLLKHFDSDGFVFFTNYQSRKGEDLAGNPRAALVFYWPQCNRQVRIEGAAIRVDPVLSDRYFASRPRGSRLSALISRQSEVVADRATLEGLLEEAKTAFEGRAVPRPANWGGYRLQPDRVEFWQGRLDRLHDRFLYRIEGGRWVIGRLFP